MANCCYDHLFGYSSINNFMKLVYIHGASATSESFNYIRSKLGKGIDIDYDSRNGFENNLQDMSEQLKIGRAHV